MSAAPGLTVRPTRACFGALAVAVVLNLLTRVTGDGWLALGSAAALVLPLASLVIRPALGSVEVSLTGPRAVVAGTTVEQQLVVTNSGDRTTPPLVWSDGALSVEVPSLEVGEVFATGVSRGAMPRGEYDGSSAELSTVAPYGLLRWTRPAPAGHRLLVHPVTDRGHALRRGGEDRGERGSTAKAGVGTEILGLRPWRPGDSSRALSARASARHGRPVVLEREREHETGPALLVVVTGTSHGPLWEAHLSSTASLALAALRDGGNVTLLSGKGGPRADRAMSASAILDFFACVDRSGEPEDEVSRRALKDIHPGGTAVWLRGSTAVGGLMGKAGSTCCHHEVLRG